MHRQEIRIGCIFVLLEVRIRGQGVVGSGDVKGDVDLMMLGETDNDKVIHIPSAPAFHPGI